MDICQATADSTRTTQSMNKLVRKRGSYCRKVVHVSSLAKKLFIKDIWLQIQSFLDVRCSEKASYFPSCRLNNSNSINSKRNSKNKPATTNQEQAIRSAKTDNPP